MNLLEDHGRRYHQMMTLSQWRAALSSRRQLLQLIKVRAGTQPRTSAGNADDLARLIDAMVAAERVHQELKPSDLMSFVRAWRDDEETWHRHLAQVPTRFGPVLRERALGLALTSPDPGPPVPRPVQLPRPVGPGRHRWAIARPAALEPA